MINTLNVTAIKVLDQDEALDFYVNKLGLEVAQDFQQGPVRWLTVRVPGDADTEIYLEEPRPPVYDEVTAAELRELITKGAVGWIAFQTDDVRALYETLRARGVTDFTQEPTDHFYGTDMGVRDPFGNAIRILQPAKVAQGARPRTSSRPLPITCTSGTARRSSARWR
jgi:catechol 2,3-dioxygenase-like lactoylglutathione lyase family enzyme